MKTRFSLISLLLVLVVSLVGFSACKKDKSKVADQRLTEVVKGLAFPQELKDNSTLVGCTYSDKTLTFRVEMDKDKLADLDVNKQRETTLEQLRTGLFPSNLIKNVVDAGASIRYIYVSGNDSVMFSFGPDELKLPE